MSKLCIIIGIFTIFIVVAVGTSILMMFVIMGIKIFEFIFGNGGHNINEKSN